MKLRFRIMRAVKNRSNGLHGFVCTYHPAAADLNPMHISCTFFNLNFSNCNEKRTKINKKEAGIGPFFEKIDRNELFSVFR